MTFIHVNRKRVLLSPTLEGTENSEENRIKSAVAVLERVIGFQMLDTRDTGAPSGHTTADTMEHSNSYECNLNFLGLWRLWPGQAKYPGTHPGRAGSQPLPQLCSASIHSGQGEKAASLGLSPGAGAWAQGSPSDS